MKCLYPVVCSGRRVFSCGQCVPCRVYRKSVWTNRILLEAMQHEHNSFATLTYREQPIGGSVSPGELSGFIKRLRFHFGGRFRFFGVGEYGDRTWRPHYHVALFGFPSCEQLGFGSRVEEQGCICGPCTLVRKAWGSGFVMLGSLELKSARYIAGYTVKKMGSVTDTRLAGRHPEFARMSLRPGIGADATWDIASALLVYRPELREEDLAVELNGRPMPLGSYLRRKVRREVGLPEKASPEYLEALREGLSAVFDAADKVVPDGMASFKRSIIAAAIGAENEQAARNLVAKFKKRRL